MPKAFIFDVFGTVVDWRSGVATVAARWFAEKQTDHDPHDFADLWRGKYQPAMQRIRSGNRGYVALDILHRENLDEVLSETGMAELFDNREREAFNRAWEQLPPWPDSVAGLSAIREKAIIAPCSNGSIALMTRLAKFGDLPWDCILGADIARNYKPHLDTYLKSCSAIGLRPGEVVMVATHNDDLKAARQAGLLTAFFPRPLEFGNGHAKDIEPAQDWDFVAENLADLATMI